MIVPVLKRVNLWAMGVVPIVGLSLLLVIPSLLITPAARAQGTTNSSRASSPAVLEQRIKPKRTAPKGADIPLPLLQHDKGVSNTSGGTEATDIVLAGVQIDGATVYSEAELAAIYEPYMGRLFAYVDAETIVEAITVKYRKDGYVLSYAVAQPQDLEFGILRIVVVEGFIEQVAFEGPVEQRRDLLLQFAEKLKAARPLTQQHLERYVMLMSDLPGLAAEPSLRLIDQATGAHELVLQLSQDRFAGYAGIDNKSTRTVGRHIAQMSGSFNSLLGRYGRTSLYAYTVPDNVRELLFLEGVQEYTLNAEGLVIGIDGWHSVSESGARLDRFDLDSYDTRAAVYLLYPIIRGSKKSLFLTGTLEYRNTQETSLGVNLYDDRLRSLRLTMRSFFIDDMGGENVLIATASQGFEFLDASSNDAPNLSRSGGRVDYTKIEANYTRYQSLPGPWSAEFGLKGQLFSDGALSGEEFRAGGGYFGRAYDPSEISGDNGAAGYIELQRNLASRNKVLQSTQVYAFYDLAAVWDDDPDFGTTKVSIASAGAGVRVLLPKDVRASVEIAKPLTEPVFAEGGQGDHFRIFFTLNVNF